MGSSWLRGSQRSLRARACPCALSAYGHLDARNLLVKDGRLSAVIDFGCLAVGDPACDVMAARKLFSAEARATFRAALAAVVLHR
jgi:aminoglycoside phosphotransferase (APT) family kinase protein